MKYILALITLAIGVNSMAQSKKEQIAILTARLDSLNKEYVQDTTYLSNTVESLDREYNIMSGMYDDAHEQLQIKSAAITDKSNTIKSLNAKNKELMQETKETQKRLDDFKRKFKKFNDSLENEMFLFSLSNGDRPFRMEGQKLPIEVEVGLYINGRFYIIDTFDDIGFMGEDEEAQLYKYKKGFKFKTNISFTPDHLGWRYIDIELIENIPYIIDTDGGGSSQTVRMRKIVFDANHNMDLIQIFNANINFGDGIDCISGDCDYKGYLSNKYSDRY
tara:strand:- start:196 stop:1023 length:828 start_codon:yes stop_codon:yes gene_type:complete